MKGFLQLLTLSSGVSTLLMKLVIFPGILRLQGCGHGWWSSEHGMASNLHKDASGVGSKPRVNCLELRPPFPGPGFLSPQLRFLSPVFLGIVSTDFYGTN